MPFFNVGVELGQLVFRGRGPVADLAITPSCIPAHGSSLVKRAFDRIDIATAYGIGSLHRLEFPFARAVTAMGVINAMPRLSCRRTTSQVRW
jgi:hypothetical protein